MNSQMHPERGEEDRHLSDEINGLALRYLGNAVVDVACGHQSSVEIVDVVLMPTLKAAHESPA